MPQNSTFNQWQWQRFCCRRVSCMISTGSELWEILNAYNLLASSQDCQRSFCGVISVHHDSEGFYWPGEEQHSCQLQLSLQVSSPKRLCCDAFDMNTLSTLWWRHWATGFLLRSSRGNFMFSLLTFIATDKNSLMLFLFEKNELVIFCVGRRGVGEGGGVGQVRPQTPVVAGLPCFGKLARRA